MLIILLSSGFLFFYRVHLIAPGCAGIKTALLFIPPARMGREHKPRSHLDTVPPGRLSATIGVYPHPCLGQDYINYTRSVDSATLAICVLLFNSAGVIIISSRGRELVFPGWDLKRTNFGPRFLRHCFLRLYKCDKPPFLL